MNIAIELFRFKQHAKTKGLDLSGDKNRFFKLKTAKAWTAWLARKK